MPNIGVRRSSLDPEGRKSFDLTTTSSQQYITKVTKTVAQPSLGKVLCEHVTTVCQVFCVLLTVFVVQAVVKDASESAEGWQQFTWHPFLYTIGWMFLMLEAIIAISPDNVFTRNLTQKNRIRFHWLCMVSAAGYCAVGFVLIYRQKGDRPHFHSSHGLYGVISSGLALLTCANGMLALYARELKGCVRPNLSKLFHGVCGAAAFLIGNIAMVYAFKTQYYNRIAGDGLQTASIWAMVAMTVWCLVRPLSNAGSRLSSLF